MRKVIATASLPLIVFGFLIFYGFSSPGDDLMKPIDAMMSRIYSIKMTGDFDQDFAAVMQEHHQGGIDVSGILLKAGKDEKLRKMAKVTSVTQQEEQKELKSIIGKTIRDDSKTTGDKKPEHNDLMESMNTMLNQMKDIKLSGDIDKDYASLMILHNQAGLDMANAEIKYGQNDNLKKIAKRMVDDQVRAIDELKDWLGKTNAVSGTK